MAKFSVERPVQVWDDEMGERYELGPDRDGVGLVEIRHYDENGKVLTSFSMPQEVWELLRAEKVMTE